MWQTDAMSILDRVTGLRAAVRTAVQTFVAVFGVALLGFVGGIAEWADSGVNFPAVSVLGKAAVSALAAAAAGLVSWAVNRFGKHPATYET